MRPSSYGTGSFAGLKTAVQQNDLEGIERMAGELMDVLDLRMKLAREIITVVAGLPPKERIQVFSLAATLLDQGTR